MPDPTPKPPKKPRQARGPISADTLASLTTAETVANAALRPEFAAAFVHQEIAPQFLTDYAALVAAARRTVARAITHTSDLRLTSRDEKDAFKALFATIRDIQKQAKRKFEATTPAKLANYLVGDPLDAYDDLTQAAITIHNQLVPDPEAYQSAPTDVLPTINAAKVKELEDRYSTLTGEDLKQARAQGGATGQRATLKDQLAVVNIQRRQIQQAIDSEFPHDKAGTNAEAREQFALQPDRPLT